ncbi:hypothetical protein IP92_02938 [Pseudoduganella flava]|uniref:DUF3168 domain-containing protein n=1 Tax=Pseudoduganella flava TaxID=871742 RepID=A0A562PQ99_9BURK|nr:hypothetical protein [Pseudoduganella flava]QGZ37768.1 hypothetical protein GO485_00985 [Pseudoduganella flava]TWI46579.1 hypothetical protein IP92_02938 [Pseudoduganella flava]
MAAVAQALADEVRALLRTAASPKTDPDGRHSVDALIDAGQCWKIVEEGVITGALVTEACGDELWVSVAVGRAQTDLVDLMADHLRDHADGRFRAIGFQTARRGLVKKAEKHGYRVAAYIVRKTL